MLGWVLSSRIPKVCRLFRVRLLDCYGPHMVGLLFLMRGCELSIAMAGRPGVLEQLLCSLLAMQSTVT